MKNKLTIAKWGLSHVPHIVEIEKNSFSMPWSTDSFLDVLESDVFDSYAAFDSARNLVGYVVFSVVADELQILNIAISPLHRGQGYGLELLSFMHVHARSKGCKYSYLEVREKNHAAIALYQKLNYVSYMRRPKYYPDTHEDAILMKADL